MEGIRFTLNGKETVYSGSPIDSLQNVLRDHYRLTSVKCGCGEGQCGACAVLIDGLLFDSCCTAVGAVAGTSVMTLEGYRDSERFAALDKAFGELAAVQCGFCTPGMIMAAEALLSKNPHPSEEEIRVGLSGNICRCTGYNAIVKAIQKASEEGDGLW